MDIEAVGGKLAHDSRRRLMKSNNVENMGTLLEADNREAEGSYSEIFMMN